MKVFCHDVREAASKIAYSLSSYYISLIQKYVIARMCVNEIWMYCIYHVA